MDKSTFSILFIMQKGKPNAQGNAPIFARITINHQMTHIATRYYLPPERWLPKEGRTVGRTKEENEVNPKFINGFEIFLRSQFNLSTNYVMKTILKFKTVYQVAIDNGWAQKNPFASFKFRYEHAERGCSLHLS